MDYYTSSPRSLFLSLAVSPHTHIKPHTHLEILSEKLSVLSG